jgi:hypothetical protein
MVTSDGRPRSLLSRHSFGITLGLLLVALLASTLGRTNAAPPTSDLGDAPDRTNHFGAPMTAYPGVPAFYPVVFDPGLGIPQGPRFANPIRNGWLGQDFSGEQDADLLPDADGITNIDPPTNTPNRDRFDDGVNPPNGGILKLPQCAQTQLRYIVTGAPAVPIPNAYVNVWFDWNRDGDWADRLTCTTSTGAVVIVDEWAVKNQPVTIVPGSAVWITPLFYSFHTGPSRDTWMRIQIAESGAVANPTTGIPDGRGPGGGYGYGEVEDYFVVYSGAGTTFKPQ